MKTLTEQIIELMPEERDGAKLEVGRTGDSQWRRDNYFFNLARTEMINKIPEILSLIRGEVIKYSVAENDDVYFIKIKKDDLLK
jgi:hypothetical protein